MTRPAFFGAATKHLRRLLDRLTADQRARYVERCKKAPRHRNGRLYDATRARIAERILLEDHNREIANDCPVPQLTQPTPEKRP